MSTMEGGLIVSDSEELDHLARAIRNHGWSRDVPAGSPIFESRPADMAELYRFIMPGYNVRPLEMCGAVGRVQLKKLDAMIAQRRRNAERFVGYFAGDPRFIIQREHGVSSWFCFTMILNPALKIARTQVTDALARADIGFRMITGGCFLRHDAIKYFDYDTVGEIVNANLAHDRGFFVGNHPRDLSPQIDRLREVLDAAVPKGA